MLKNYLPAVCAVAFLLNGCDSGSGNLLATFTPMQQDDADVVNGLLVRGPLQAVSADRMVVMGQVVSVNSDTQVTGVSFGNLSVGDVVSVFGQRQGGVIISIEIRIEPASQTELVTGTPVLQASGHFTLAGLSLSFSGEFSIADNPASEFVFEGQFDEESDVLNIEQYIDISGPDSSDIDQSGTGETGDRLLLNLAGDSVCGIVGERGEYQLQSIELTSDFRSVTRDVSTEATITPNDGTVTVDAISDQGISMRFAEQGITEVDFAVEGDRITRYFAALNGDVSTPVLLQRVDADSCAFAYFADNQSGCAIAVSGSSGSVAVAASSGSDVSVESSGGNIQFGDRVTITNCSVDDTGGVSVIPVGTR